MNADCKLKLQTGTRGRPVVEGFSLGKLPAFPPLLIGGEILEKTWKKMPKLSFENKALTSVDWLTFNFIDEYKPPTTSLPSIIEKPKYFWDLKSDPLLQPDFDFDPYCIRPSEQIADIFKTIRRKDWQIAECAAGMMIGCVLSWNLFYSACNEETGEIVDDMIIGKVGYHRSQNSSGQTVYRWIVDISGSRCQFWNLPLLRQALENREARITRLDIAVDDFEGQIPFEMVMEMESKGYFVNRRPLYANPVGLLRPDEGRTLYVGRKQNGKVLCVYEKGKEQKNDLMPNWIRWELRLGNQDGRVIPYDALIDPAKYFKGSFRSFAVIFREANNSDPVAIKTKQIEAASNTVEQFAKYLKTSYGKFIYECRALGVPDSMILDVCSREGHQKSLGSIDLKAIPQAFANKVARGEVSDFGASFPV